jgi:RNA polymerase sigma factor (sigma-70 family)
MNMTESRSLLGDYVKTGSEPAFREILARYIDLVYSAAVRLVDGDIHLAQDVTQTVFVDLARKARTLPSDVMLGGWLHHHTVFVSATVMRGERRRRRRERQAVEMSAFQNNTPPDLGSFAPVLDEAIDKLGTLDRTAILLRFFEQLDFRSVGDVLGSNEDAARKRVSRALDKLQVLLKHRGITVSATGLGTALAAGAIAVAPTGLAATVATTALTDAAVGGAVSSSLFKVAAILKMQAGAIGALAFALMAAFLVLQQREQTKIREMNQLLHQQLQQLESRNQQLQDSIVQSEKSLLANNNQSREILKLRGEVTLLRRHQKELELAAAQLRRPGPDLPSGANLLPAKPAPFQVQIVLDGPGDDSETMTNNSNGSNGETLYVQKSPLLDYTAISSATVTTNTSTGAPQIAIAFSEEGKDLFAQITRENLNKRLAIVLDGHLYSAPVIKTEIAGGRAEISGSFTEPEAKELALKINDAIVQGH